MASPHKTPVSSNTPTPRLPLEINSSVSVHPVGEELLLFNADHQQFSRLNQTASIIWTQGSQIDSLDGLVDELSTVFGVTADVLRDDVELTLADWQNAGLLDREPVDIEIIDDEAPPAAQSGDPGQTVGTCLPPFRLIDSNYSICCFDKSLIPLLRPLFAHLPECNDGPVHHLHVGKLDDAYCLIESRQLVGHCVSAEEMVPIVNAHVMVSAYHDVDCLAVFHAGAVSDGKQVIVLSAASGSGKSTLTAALAGSGAHLYSDEIVVLNEQGHVRAAPACIGLKTGAWDVVQNYWPGLGEQPHYRRQDDKQVKFLAPAPLNPAFDPTAGLPIAAFVFPQYDPSHQSALTKIGPADALVQLTDAGYHTNTPLDAQSADRLIRIIEAVPCYSLAVNALDEAIETVGALFGAS
ncbi:MAG: PqqD family peptide modification chaperone [Pseudomonadota bacterium]